MDMSENFNNTIKQRRIAKGLTMKELAEKVGVSESTISRWESGDIENMRRNKIAKLSQVLDLDPAIVMGFEPKSKRPPRRAFRVPVLGRVAAGIPIEAIEEVVDWEDLPEDEFKDVPESYFGLKIKGDSMTPRICDGDTVIVHQQPDAESGEIVIAMVNGDDAVCKRLKKYADSIALISTNPSYEPLTFSAEEIATLPVRIVGKVVELRGKF